MKDISLLKKPVYKGILEDKNEISQGESIIKSKQKTIGRPPLEQGEKKTEFVRIYLTKIEKEKLSNKIATIVPGFQISKSQFIRKLLIDNDCI